MPLSSIVRRAIDLNTVMGVTKQPNAVADAVSLIQVSDETTARHSAGLPVLTA